MKRMFFLLLVSLIFLVVYGCGDDPLSPGDAFLEENAKKDGVVVTASGLQYEVITQGSGPLPQSNSTVVVNYRGTFIDGSEFDSGNSVAFPVGAVISGWTEALLLMNVGSEYRLVIPPELAYGSRGRGNIGPNEVLVFDVELLSIQ